MTSNQFRPSDPMYKQVADFVAGQIISGELPAGSPLPSENELIEQFGVSRQTIRAAMAEMRAMGLVDSSRGKRSAVRAPAATAAVTIERAVTRQGKAFSSSPADDWQEAERPTVTRADASGITADLLGGERAHVFTVERLLISPAGVRAAHRTVIPFAVAEQAPVLAAEPDRLRPAAIYAALTDAGHRLTWHETVTARAPHPDERTSLRLDTYAAPILLLTYRVAKGTSDHPLILEELRISADHARLGYPLTAAKAPARPKG